jgi:polygalacturonase
MYNVLEFGAKSCDSFNSTNAFQAAIDTCHANGGGVVYIPYGTYMLASMHLYSNIHFVFEPGATLLGSLNPNDFDERESVDYPLYQDVSHSYFHRSMFWAEDCENISFSGNGTIDMREVWENKPTKNAHLNVSKRANKIFALKYCKNVVIKDLNLYNATDLAVYLAGCEDCRITGLNIKVNIDGISPDGCKNIIISDCNIVAGDDAIVPKSSYTLNKKIDCENIVITNCVVSSRMCAIKFGTETNGGFKNVTISNCTIYDTCYTGLAIEIADGGEIDGLVATGITMKNVGSPFIITLTDRKRGPEGTPVGSIKNVIIDNLIATGPYQDMSLIRYTATLPPDTDYHHEPKIIASSVTGLEDSVLENISLSNIYLTVPGGCDKKTQEIEIPDKPIPTPAAFSYSYLLPAYGIYFKHVKNLKLRNINTQTLEPDMRNNMVFECIENLKID